jgi:hypothetical protein
MGIDKDYSIEDIRAESIEKLYDILASCASPGYYQMAVEELQRRFLQDIAAQARSLAESSQHVETVTRTLEGSVTAVGGSVVNLVDSSRKLEQLTKAIIWLTVALFLLTLIQVGLVFKDQFSTKPIPGVRPAIQQTQPAAPPKEAPK